jgi:MFS family permease
VSEETTTNEERAARPEPPVRLSRNRNYNVLWTSLLLSDFGTEVVAVAFPLLILSTTGSAVQLGLVVSVMAVARMVAGIPAGVVADRWNRRTAMLTAQGFCALALASVAVTLSLDACSFGQILAVAAVQGVFGSVFQPAEQAALPQVVPESQLQTALARNAARPFAALLLGPALAGFAFAVDPAAPFLAVAALLAISFAVLLFLRLPPRASEPGTVAGTDAFAGFRWLLGQPVLRTTILWVVLVNLVFNALIVVILALSGENRIGPAQIGLMMTCLGVGGLIGALFAARLQAVLPAPVIVLGSTWAIAVIVAVMALVPAGIPLGLLLGAVALFFPVANTTIMTYQLMVVPDELRGRLGGMVGLCAATAETVGPMAGGFLIVVSTGGAAGIVACAAALACVGLGASLSPAMRRFPAPRTAAEPES